MLDRDIVFDAGIAVGNERHVHVVERATLGHDVQPFGPRGLHHHLPLVAARLIVVLDRDRPFRLQPPHRSQRVLVFLDVDEILGPIRCPAR